jgi:methionyl-tRNA formyltransferase
VNSEIPKADLYFVAGSRSWNRTVFSESIAKFSGTWHFADSPDSLEALLKHHPRPRYIFFLHWSARVPSALTKNHECICFHMTDVPYGRGGSPLQNLIALGHSETKVTALRMVDQMDAGPVYLKRPLSLAGAAEEIFLRANKICASMIKEIIETHPVPTPQEGDVVTFKRRTPAQSAVPPHLKDLGALYDFIRMLDAGGYPNAFIEFGGFRLEFNRASLYDRKIVADVKISRVPES